MFPYFVICVIGLLSFIYWKLKSGNKRWNIQGVPQAEPNLLVGNMGSFLLQRISLPELHKNIYDKFTDKRYYGIYQFTSPMLAIKDPDLIKQLLVKDFDHFTDHRPVITEEVDPLFGKNLLLLQGKRWRDMRTTLSPAFTSLKMKAMFDLILQTADQFMEYFHQQENEQTDIIPIEVKDVFSRFTTDAIATTAFGLECKSLENKDNNFFKMGRQLVDFNLIKTIRFFCFMLSPFLMKLLNMKVVPNNIGNYFSSIIIETLKVREENGIVRPDMIQLLMKARKGELHHEENNKPNHNKIEEFAVIEEVIEKVNRKETLKLTDEDIVAQALAFFLGGFETTSTLMSYMAYELALNKEIQKRLQKEIDETLNNSINGRLNYESLKNMKYMDMVVSETLRKWPPLFATDRRCISPYTIEPKKPGEFPVHMENEDVIWIPIFAIHRDDTNYPKPENFDPERFSEENKHKINPFAFLPFGAGPRSCIGTRLALMECKTVFASLLSKYEIVSTEQTQIPVQLSKKTFTMASEKGIWLGLKKREDYVKQPQRNCWNPPTFTD